MTITQPHSLLPVAILLGILLLLLFNLWACVVPVEGADLGFSFSMRTPKKGNITDWEIVTDLRGDMWGDPQQARLLFERENSIRETGRTIRLSRTVGPFLLTGQDAVKTARKIDAQKAGVLLKGKIISGGVAYSWLAWENPRPVLDVQARWEKKWEREVLQASLAYSTDFRKRQTTTGELRLTKQFYKRLTIGTFCNYLKNIQGECWQAKSVFGIKL